MLIDSACSPPGSRNSRLSAGAIVGVVIGGVLALVIVAIIGMYIFREHLPCFRIRKDTAEDPRIHEEN